MKVQFRTAPFVLLSIFVMSTVSGYAQEESDSEGAPPVEDLEEAPKPQMGPRGDVLHLKSGTSMTGIQILKSTPHFYEIELVEGVDPLMIPRNQVKSVEFDDFDPARDRLRREMFPEAEEVSLASGEKVTKDLMDKLQGPVSAEALSYERTDFVEILKETASRLGVKLQIDPSVQAIQPNRRRWTFNTTPETTFISMLRDDLVSKFNTIEVVFENDTVSIMTKEAAKKVKASDGTQEN